MQVLADDLRKLTILFLDLLRSPLLRHIVIDLDLAYVTLIVLMFYFCVDLGFLLLSE